MRRCLDQPLDDAAGIGPAVDVVAEIDLDCTSDGCRFKIALDHRGKLLQQIVAAVDVANGIDAQPLRERARRHAIRHVDCLAHAYVIGISAVNFGT